MSIRIVIADDHETVRLGLRQFVAGSDIKIVAEGATGEQAIKLALKHDPDVVMLDVQMPEVDGLTALSRIKTERPTLPVLIFSAFDTPSYVARSVALGASGYLLKVASKQQVLDAIRTVARGEMLWTREELRRCTSALAAPRLTGHLDIPLSQREGEILRRICNGATNKEIALKMNLSYETIKEQVQYMLRKLAVTDRTQAAVWAVRRGLVSESTETAR